MATSTTSTLATNPANAASEREYLDRMKMHGSSDQDKFDILDARDKLMRLRYDETPRGKWTKVNQMTFETTWEIKLSFIFQILLFK